MPPVPLPPVPLPPVPLPPVRSVLLTPAVAARRERLEHLLEFLGVCIATHNVTARRYLLGHNILSKIIAFLGLQNDVISLGLSCPASQLALTSAVLKVFRSVLQSKDDFYYRAVSKAGLPLAVGADVRPLCPDPGLPGPQRGPL
jgi:hypothetical protein